MFVVDVEGLIFFVSTLQNVGSRLLPEIGIRSQASTNLFRWGNSVSTWNLQVKRS